MNVYTDFRTESDVVRNPRVHIGKTERSFDLRWTEHYKKITATVAGTATRIFKHYQIAQHADDPSGIILAVMIAQHTALECALAEPCILLAMRAYQLVLIVPRSSIQGAVTKMDVQGVATWLANCVQQYALLTIARKRFFDSTVNSSNHLETSDGCNIQSLFGSAGGRDPLL